MQQLNRQPNSSQNTSFIAWRFLTMGAPPPGRNGAHLLLSASFPAAGSARYEKLGTILILDFYSPQKIQFQVDSGVMT